MKGGLEEKLRDELRDFFRDKPFHVASYLGRKVMEGAEDYLLDAGIGDFRGNMSNHGIFSSDIFSANELWRNLNTKLWRWSELGLKFGKYVMKNAIVDSLDFDPKDATSETLQENLGELYGLYAHWTGMVYHLITEKNQKILDAFGLPDLLDFPENLGFIDGTFEPFAPEFRGDLLQSYFSRN